MPNLILDQARARLSAIAAERAALDVEERELRAMVAAADGVKATPAPAPQPFTVPWPYPVPIIPTIAPNPYPLTPWIVGAPHGGMCACPTCCPPVYCGAGTTTAELHIGDMRTASGASLTAQMPAVYRRDDVWKEWGASDVSLTTHALATSLTHRSPSVHVSLDGVPLLS